VTVTGRVEVIVGGMFGGKTEELVRRLRRAEIARQRVVCVKPSIDDRYHATDVASHAGATFRAVPVRGSAEALAVCAGADVVGVDEAQFFDAGIVEVVRNLAASGVRVIVAGLDLDYRGAPFGPMPALMAEAEDVTKVHAVCTVCGGDASRSQRVVASDSVVLVGATEFYEARCRAHWSPNPEN
jgi:thymidine kinase